MSRILIVDDERMYRHYLTQILEREGHTVQAASTGQEAIQSGGTLLPDILIADWALSDDRNGLEVAEALQKVVPNMQTILISGFLAEEVRQRMGRTPVFRLLEKPFSMEDLLKAVREALAQCTPHK